MKLQVWIRMSNDEIKTIPKHFNEKKAACKTQHFTSLPAFLSITITLFQNILMKRKQPVKRNISLLYLHFCQLQ